MNERVRHALIFMATVLLVALFSSAVMAQNETNFPTPGGTDHVAHIGGIAVPFLFVLALVPLIGYFAAEYLPGIDGAAKPYFIGAISAVMAVAAQAIFGIGYEQAAGLFAAGLTSSWVNSAVRSTPGLKNLKKKE